MTTPTPDAQNSDHVSHNYQATSEGSDHSLLGHSHQCLYPSENSESPTPTDHCHAHGKLMHPHHAHLNVINQLSHAPRSSNHPHSLIGSQSMHVHASVHASPKSGTRTSHVPKTNTANPCTCHLQTSSETAPPEIHEANIVQNRKLDADDNIEPSPLPPALPPRPPPRQRICEGGGLHSSRGLREGVANTRDAANGSGIKKYVFWCCACGGMSTLIGALFLAVYFMLRSYTSTLGYFETIPTFVPATMLILTGLCVMSLARRRNRFSYLIKVSGVCCLVCALTCVLVTITTTVIHMNRLQTLRECVYTQKTRTCTCYSVLLEANAETDEGTRFVFDSTPDCEVIHGALYSCLRAMFGLSVSGILVCIFSCMLVYQLLSHERKKMYWEQLELRCRSLYQHQTSGGALQGSMRGPPVALGPGPAFCSCCEECRYTPVPANPHMYSWEAHALDRFWAPGRVGNFYSPNPGEEIVGNSSGATGNTSTVPTVSGNDGNNRSRDSRAGGWSWRRLPWTRGCPETSRTGNNLNYPAAINSPDSQYGFSTTPSATALAGVIEPISTAASGYSVLTDRPVTGAYLWGPPPPYSNPDSPARRNLTSPNRYHHPHHHTHHPHSHSTHCQLNDENQTQSSVPPDCQHRSRNRSLVSHFPNKENYENTTEPEIHQIMSDSNENTDNSNSDCVSNTLPIRKTKKRVDIPNLKPNIGGQNFCSNISNIFTNQNFNENIEQQSVDSDDHSYQEPNIKPKPENMINTVISVSSSPENNSVPKCRFLPRLQGVENPAFQNQEPATQQQQKCSQRPKITEQTESEVYFADVSSCCNISVRNDGQDSSLYDEAVETVQKPRLMSLQCTQKNEKENVGSKLIQNFQENISSSTVTEDEDYLAHRIGKRQMSTRSRLPFPLPNHDDHESDINTEASLQLLPKDISQNSLCSSVQTPNTESTDDALTPVSQSFNNSECCLSGFYPENKSSDGIPHPRHRTFSGASDDNQFIAPDAQYEIIQQSNTDNVKFQRHFTDIVGTNTCNSNDNFNNLTNTISGLNNFGNQTFGNFVGASANNPNFSNAPNFSPNTNHQDFNTTNVSNLLSSNKHSNFTPNFSSNLNFNQSNSPKHTPPKSLSVSLNNSPRKTVSSNISTLIQNLGGNPVGLLYGEANSTEEEEISGHVGGNHSDGTMDSGWQSGSDRTDGNRGDSSEDNGHRSVNV